MRFDQRVAGILCVGDKRGVAVLRTGVIFCVGVWVCVLFIRIRGFSRGIFTHPSLLARVLCVCLSGFAYLVHDETVLCKHTPNAEDTMSDLKMETEQMDPNEKGVPLFFRDPNEKANQKKLGTDEKICTSFPPHTCHTHTVHSR